jgi:hypothetical protein
MQQVLHYSALRTGVAYLPVAFVIIVSAGLAQQLVTRWGIRPVLTLGAVAGFQGKHVTVGLCNRSAHARGLSGRRRTRYGDNRASERQLKCSVHAAPPSVDARHVAARTV